VLRDIMGRHKEVLTELFYITENGPPVPEDAPPSSEFPRQAAGTAAPRATPSDLTDFLMLNSLERCASLVFSGVQF
jgi:hypothetical protein